MPTQSTPAHRILARWRPKRRDWRAVRITPTHRVAFDPTVYDGPIFPGREHYKADPQFDFIEDDRVGSVALLRRVP